MDAIKAFVAAVKGAFKSPQALLSAVAVAVATLGTVGILNDGQSGALQALFTAILGVIVAFGHHVASAAVSKHEAAKDKA